MTEVDPTLALNSLSSSLTTLESTLAPLLATPFADLLAQPGPDGQGLDPLLQAKLQVLTGYVVHDLIWIYCRTAGVDPNTHPVLQELLRLKTYFDKLSSAENGPTPPPASNRPQLDKAAAGRFIKAAINSARPKTPVDYTPSAGPSTPQELGEKGTHIRFDGEKEEMVKKLLEESEDDDDDEEEEQEVVVEAPKPVAEKKKDKGKSRSKMDPFAGYDSPRPQSKSKSKSKPSPSTPKHSSSSSTNPRPSFSSSGEKRKRVEEELAEDGASTPSSSAKKERKRERELKKLKMKGEGKGKGKGQ